MFLVLDLYWQEFCKLRDSKKKRFCRVSKAKVSNCDAVNLGCLLQQFPDLDDPRRTPPSRDETVNSLVARSEQILEVLISKSGDHGFCAVGPRLAAASYDLLGSVQGLELGSL